IDLSDGSGFNVLEKVGETNFHVIFITAFNEYAIKAFRYNALDYILKPIDIELLNQAIAKIEYDKGKEYITRDELKEILNNLINSEEDKKLIIKDKNSTSYVRIGDIIRCEADGSYTIIHLVNGDKVVVSRALKVYSSLLPESMFFRVHQSNLINLRCVKKISKKDGGYVMMEDGTDVPIARRRKEEFLEALENSIS
ncbi:MAG: response regulator transcription factor, partial [Crocinitomicaceae bacterium]|nr:response regulator transcription factor [Crocinitomicaceae bacterium]